MESLAVKELVSNWFPELTVEQVRAALDYYRDHTEEVDERLRRDREIAQSHESIPA